MERECQHCGAPMRTFEDRDGEPMLACMDDCQGKIQAEDDATEEGD